jgi:hypothetical protein
VSPQGRNALVTDYDVYHDESQVAGFWHGILLVPRESRQRLLSLLAAIRQNTGRTDPISLKQLDKSSGPLFRCISCWIQVGVAALLQRFKGEAYSVPTGLAGQRTEFVPFTQILGARFVLFRVTCPMNTLKLCPDHTARVETTFRMAFKGGLSLFSRAGHELRIRSLHFDGHKQYGRRLELYRILRGIENEFEIPNDIVLDDATSDHREPDGQSYDDCQLLQLTDLLVSGFRTVLSEGKQNAQLQVAEPLRKLATRFYRGQKGFSNSRWHLGFCLSEGTIEDGHWKFGPIPTGDDSAQPRLF